MKRSRLSLLAAVAVAAVLAAGNLSLGAEPGVGPENFAFWLEGPDGTAVVEAAQGQEVEVLALMKVEQGEVQGWSFGVCHEDQSVVTVTDATVTGTDTSTVNGGNPPDFETTTTYPGGVTTGVVIQFTQQNFLAPTERFSALKITYRMDGAAGSATRAEFCDTLGKPPVDSVVVVGGQSINPATMDGADLKVKEEGEEVIKPFLATSPAEQNLPADKTATVQVEVELGLSDASTSSVGVQGWSYGISHDGSLLELTAIEPTELTNTSNNGSTPDFYAVNINPVGGAGGTVGAVVSLGPEFYEIPLEPGQKIHTETFTYRSATELGENDDPVTTKLSLADEVLGDPPVTAVMVILSDGVTLTEGDMASITLVPPTGRLRPFVRGDANNDARVDIADGVWVLSWIYRGGLEPPCQDAADANDDGTVDQADAILIIYYRLRGGEPPLPPFPSCGTDPSDSDSDNPEDGLTCKAIGAGCGG